MAGDEAGTILDYAVTALDERQRALQTFGLSGMDLAPTVGVFWTGSAERT